jgi:oligopeptide transport system substrate-binding protein
MKTLFVGLVVVLTLAAACGDDDVSDEETESSEREQPDDDRRQGGQVTLAVGFHGELDPHAANYLPEDDAVARMLWRGLYSLTADNRLTDEQNGIADGPPQVSEDGLTVTVRMREGLSWSDGDDLRGEDYVAAIIRSCSPLIGSGLQYLLGNLKGCNGYYFADPASADLDALQAAVGVRAVDAVTVEFTLEQPQPSFPAALTLPLSFPVPVHLDRFATQTPGAPAEWGTDPAQLVYNGPYVLTEFVAGEQAVFEPNSRWSGSTQPTLERVTFRFFDDPATGLDSYKDGEIQLTGIVGEQLIEATKAFGDEYFQEIRTTTLAVYMNLADETLANLDVRLALARAIDREALNQAIAAGGFVPTTTWIPEVTSGLPPESYEDVIGFDPEAARDHLAEAGYPNGDGFPPLKLMALTLVPSYEFEDTAAFLERSFQEVLNIGVELELLGEDAFFERLNTGDFDLALLGWIQDYPDPENWILGLFDTDGQANFGGCSDPEIDALIEEARLNPNDEERRSQYREVERQVIERVCGPTPYIHIGLNFLIKPELVGFRENASGNDILLPGEGVPEAWGLRAE